ncbi:hypothetical protein M0657_011888 [Pyricularia oryzae]|nr:hypothetical protein M0657_011888 [Pyricularia oryzae]
MVKDITEVLQKLDKGSRMIVKSGVFEKTVDDRIIQAGQLLADGGPKLGSEAFLKRKLYTEFLQRACVVAGIEGAIFCAAGLGCSYIHAMGKNARIDLLACLRQKLDEFKEFEEMAAKHEVAVNYGPRQQIVDGRHPPPTQMASTQLGGIEPPPTQMASTQLGGIQPGGNQLPRLDLGSQSYQTYVTWQDVQNSLTNHTTIDGAPVLVSNLRGTPAYVAFPVTWEFEFSLLTRVSSPSLRFM